jgi:uncharacterized protein
VSDRERSQEKKLVDKVTLDNLIRFVTPLYAAKDEMHGLGHVRRLARDAATLAEGDDVDKDVLLFGAYLHGIISTHERAIRAFLESLGLDQDYVARILQVAWESGKEATPKTKEGIYLHDAHLIEGGPPFGIAKCLITGAQRGQSLEETLNYIEQNLLGRFRCITPQAQALYDERERFTREFVAELRKNLDDSRQP